MTNLFTPSEFDDWAANYDRETLSDGGFPFEGYSTVLRTIVQLAAPRAGASILDLGIGTGNLALLLEEQGCRIWGLDFSAEMVKLARQKMPSATLAISDLRAPLPAGFPRQYDRIVSAYTFHHFPLAEKVGLIHQLFADHLRAEGSMVIGDIAFTDLAAEDLLRQQLADEWEQEYYWLAGESLAALAAAGLTTTYTQVSSCAGVFLITRQQEE